MDEKIDKMLNDLEDMKYSCFISMWGAKPKIIENINSAISHLQLIKDFCIYCQKIKNCDIGWE